MFHIHTDKRKNGDEVSAGKNKSKNKKRKMDETTAGKYIAVYDTSTDVANGDTETQRGEWFRGCE